MRKLKNEELGRKSVLEYKSAEKTSIVIVLDNVRSMNNIGSIFRTSDAFLVEAIYLCGFTATPPHKEIHKTALGAEDAVDWRHFDQTIQAIEELIKKEYIILSLEQAVGSVELGNYKFDPNEKYALVYGNEIKGVSQEVVNMSDACIEIPQFGTKHSFNIVVSVGIVLWEIASQLGKIKKGGK